MDVNETVSRLGSGQDGNRSGTTLTANEPARRKVLMGLAGLLGARPAMQEPRPRSTLGDAVAAAAGDSAVALLDEFNISPDGRIVVFQYHVGQNHLGGLGLYEWRTGKLTRIPGPPDMQLSSPSFSYDGRRITAVLSRQGTYHSVAIIDLATMSCTPLTDPLIGQSYVVYPVFQPGTDRILYCQSDWPYPTGLKLVEISNRKQETVLPATEGFYRLYRPSFVKLDEIYFSAVNSYVKDLQTEKRQTGLSGECSFQLRFGGVPEYLFRNLAADAKHPALVYNTVSASQDGKTVIMLGINLKTPSKPSGETNYEVFRIEPDGQPVQLTNVFGYLGYCRVSYDGSAVAFGSKPGRGGPTELNILDLRTNQVVRTELGQRLREDTTFAG